MGNAARRPSRRSPTVVDHGWSPRHTFGLNGQVLTMDYEEVKTQQKSFEMLAGYINGSTVNVTVAFAQLLSRVAGMLRSLA
jgi:hypothetical protein